jgi:hypothetical protein
MSRVRVRDNSNPVQLFPFVAVLLCTMGSLLVILVVVARCSWDQGVRQAAEMKRADAENPKAVDELRQKLTAVHSYVEQLGSVRAEAAQKLESDQMQLSHLEDHMRRMQDRLESLRAAAGELEGMEHEHYDDRAQAEREVARLSQLIDETQKDITDLKQHGNGKPRSYAIVPFVGRNGTRRPPIYVECRGNEVILQPEGIHLTADDVAPELGPGAPLAAALRAAREYMVSQNAGAAGTAAAEPYPLLLVRPKGEGAFYDSRAVFEHCGIQFGYELVDGNWDLKFPPANPELAAREMQAIELARGRAKALAEAAPGMLRHSNDDLDNDEGDDFTGSPGGSGSDGNGRGSGGDGEDGDSDGGADSGSGGSPAAGGGFVLGVPAGTGQAGMSAVGAANQGSNLAGASAAGGGTMLSGGAGAAATWPGAGTAGTNAQPNGAVLGDAGGSGLPNLLADARSGVAGEGEDGGGGSNGGPSAGASGSTGAASTTTKGPQLTTGASSPAGGSGFASGSNGYSSGSGGYPSGSGESAASGGAVPSGALPGDPAPSTPGATIIGAADGSSEATAAVVKPLGARPSGAVEVDDEDSRPPAPTGPGMYRDRPPEQLATKPPDDKPVERHHARGKNWALIDANAQATPIRRTIQAVVRGDRVAVLPEGTSAAAGAAGGREIPLTGNSRDAYEPFMMALESQIKDWGMAGRGLYWRPVLEVNVGPDGQQRAADIARLLKNSGIELRTSSAVAAQNQGTPASASSSR